MKEFILKLEESEVNYILNVLAAQPFKEVFQIMPKVQGQCLAQQDVPALRVAE